MRLDIWQAEREKAEVLPCGMRVLKDTSISGKPCLKMWMPKGKNPFANYSFHSEEQREKYIAERVASLASHNERKEQYKKERQGTPELRASVKVGDLFHYSWGYDQTNCEYYQVVEVLGAFAVIREIGQHKSLDNPSEGFMCENRVPSPNHFIGEPMRKKIQFWGNAPHFAMSFGCASRWNGKPDYCSWYA